jgi:hypothetical protein
MKRLPDAKLHVWRAALPPQEPILSRSHSRSIFALDFCMALRFDGRARVLSRCGTERERESPGITERLLGTVPVRSTAL